MKLVDSTAKGEERSERHEADFAEVAAVSAEREPNGGGSAAGLSPPRWARNENATMPTPEGDGSCGHRQ